jgi:hypothetical protein
MRFRLLASATLVTAPLMLLGANAGATEFSATFSGFEEVGGLGAGETGAILSAGKATLDLDLNRQARTVTFKLTYSGLSDVLQSHIHFGKRHVAGGVIVFFCTNLGNGPAGTQACPTSAGTVTGMIVGGNVVGPAAQNVPAGDFDALVAALDSDTAYGNIHTKNFPAGEIRGQVRRDDDDRR